MDKPFDQEILQLRERPLSTDHNQAWSQIFQTMRDFFQHLYEGRAGITDGSAVPPPYGFIGNGFRPVPGSGMQVVLKPGTGFIYSGLDTPSGIGGVLGVNDKSPFKPLSLLADQPVAIDAAPSSGQERFDIIEVNYQRLLTDLSSRGVFSPSAGDFVASLVAKTLQWNIDGAVGRVVSPASSTTPIGYKVGIAAAVNSAVVPSNTAGYVTVARVHVLSSTAAIQRSNIADFRPLLFPGNVAEIALDYSVSTTGGGPNLPTVNQLICPPGIEVAVVGQAAFTARAGVNIYIIGGNIQQVICTSAVSGNLGSAKEQCIAFGSTDDLTPAEQTDLTSGASSNPTLNADIGNFPGGTVFGAPIGSVQVYDDIDSGSLPSGTNVSVSMKISY